jgi:predicted DNA-binding protein with PD1-like motif/glutaredoxin
MRVSAIHLDSGADVRRSLEELAHRENAQGFVLSVVGNMRQARFACPGRSGPTVLSGELEIITLQGTIGPQGVHLHLSFSDGDCQVWGGHLEHGSLILKGADLLVGFLDPAEHSAQTAVSGATVSTHAVSRLTIAVADGCPWSQRALRMLRTLAIPFELVPAEAGRSLPQIAIDGQPIGGYSELAELHGRGALDALRRG